MQSLPVLTSLKPFCCTALVSILKSLFSWLSCFHMPLVFLLCLLWPLRWNLLWSCSAQHSHGSVLQGSFFPTLPHHSGWSHSFWWLQYVLMFPFLGVSMAPRWCSIECTPFYLASVSLKRLGTPWRQKLSLHSQSLVSTGLPGTVSSPVLFPKLQLYIAKCLWTFPLGALINMLKIESIIFQSPKHFLFLCFLPEWIENIIYPAA